MEERAIFFALVLLWPEISFVCKGQFSFPSKKATQSQTYASSTADRAIDGNPNTCSLAAIGSGSSAFGWWQVDLGNTFTVSSVTVTSGGSDGSQPEYLQNFAIFVGDTNNTEVGDSNLCYYFNNGSFVPTGVPLKLDCTPNPLNGRYVTIKRRGGFRQDAIGLCEVNIKYYIQLPLGYINILYLPTNQTGGYMDQNNVFYGSNFANDWNLQTCSEPINPSGTPIWYVDLQDFYAVTAVTAFNQDSNATFNSVPRYLSYFYVRVGNSTDLSSQTQCCYYNDVVPVGGNVTCTCQSTIIGRYISIERTSSENPRTLVICEVLVQGYKANASWTSSSTATPIIGSGSSALNPPSTLPTISPNETQPLNGTLGDSQEAKNRIIIICVVVIIGGLLLLGGAAALAYFLLRGRLSKTPGGRKSIEILPFRRMSYNTYSNGSPDHEHLTKPIRESDLPLYVENRKSNPSTFKAEFKKLPEDEAKEATVGRKPNNKMKNRFANVVPYDHTLVPLKIEEFDDPEGDYINANFIEGYKNVEKMYIATQGPRPNTIEDFWRMIWQQNVNLIIMVTSLIENGKRKCEKYWPENVQSTSKFNKISVTLVVEEVYAHYAYREMIVHDERQHDKAPRTVRQMHFLTWSDKTRPDHYLSLLSFRRNVRCFYDDTTGPIVVHCSAGIGRSGTYIALDILLEQLKDEHEISVFGCVETLRFQRMTMVQTAEQYLFLHEALADGLQSGDTGIPCASFAKEYIEMAKMDGSLSKLEQQFILLRKMKEAKTEKYSSGAEQKNISKNRDKEIVACDDGRPYLEATYYNGGDYINAVYADSYRSKDSYILTQLPLTETIIDFWRLIWDHQLKTIVLLDEIETGDENCPMYWPQESVTEAYGPFEVEVMLTKELSSTIFVREFTLTNTKERKDPLSIRQYQIKGWPNGHLVPSKPSLLLELMNILMANAANDKLVIQCIDGAVRSGLFAAAMHLIDMMKVEQVVDVFLACRFIAINRPQVVSSMEQYSFLHDLACTCMMQYEEYDNCQPSIAHEKQSKTSDSLAVYANVLDSKPTTIKGLSASKPVKLGDF